MKKTKRLLFGAIKKAWAVVFNGTTTSINAGSEASVDDLHDAAFTAEGWFLSTATGNREMFDKIGGGSGGWYLRQYATGLYAFVFCATTNADIGVTTSICGDNQWHHVAMTWDDAGDRKIRVFIDGVLFNTNQTVGDGAIVSDAASNLLIGDGVLGLYSGNIGWCRISNVVRYAANFSVPSRFIAPTVDANTVRLFKMNEGSGTTIIDYSANAQNATLANGTWIKS